MDISASKSKEGLRRALTKVPEITVYFWIIKILTTAMGESTSDYLVAHLNPLFAVALSALVFTCALALQFIVRRYVAWVYWLAVAMVAVFGTMAADTLHIGLGVPYLFSTIFFAITLAVIFILWYCIEKTLSIHSIYTRRREIFYWATVLGTFALGTAAGDMTAATLGLGYLYSGILFGVLIAAVTAAHYATKGILGMEHRHQSRNAVAAFWCAYVLTRPLGASFADWFGKSHAIGGLGFGDGPVSLVLTIIIICFVVFLTVTRRDVEKSSQDIAIDSF